MEIERWIDSSVRKVNDYLSLSVASATELGQFPVRTANIDLRPMAYLEHLPRLSVSVPLCFDCLIHRIYLPIGIISIIGSSQESENGSYSTYPCSDEFSQWIFFIGVTLIAAGMYGSWYELSRADSGLGLVYGFIITFGSLGMIGFGGLVIFWSVGAWHVCALSSVSVPVVSL
jgi:hypothetical protein